MKVRYKYETSDDLVCELTEFIDEYLIGGKLNYCCTYLYNDLDIFSNEENRTHNMYQIAFRYPGATRGGIILKRINKNEFEILDFHFNEDVCFGEFKRYKESLKEDIKRYVGSILDFSEVELKNNI